MPPEPPPAALRLVVDSEAIAANWRALDRLSGEASAGAAVKADAYGTGVAKALPALVAVGARDFFVAHWSEVAAVLKHTAPASVSVLHGPLTRSDADYAIATGVKPVINSLQQARLWQDAGGGLCDLMIDTGINRLGLPMGELGHEAITALDVDILMSHLASADEDVPQNAQQLALWQDARGQVAQRRASLANSAGICLGPQYHGDLTRPGLSLYGGIPRPELEDQIVQVARPQAAIMQVREIGEGEAVGYNATFRAEGPMRIGAVAIGYADGYLRCWSGLGSASDKGLHLPVLGRVSMDMTILDLTAAPALKEGDWVEIDYPLPSASAKSGLSQYELLTLLGTRFAR
ncbi:MAG: alanine racemase [Sphingomonadaceae bacterium]|jgi:alanine racemase